jgi:hypothetical protein
MCENRILKLIKIIKGGIRKSNGGWIDQTILHEYMEISQWNTFVQLAHTNNNTISAVSIMMCLACAR